jgi:Xaa-Pro aminopeptidase
VDKLDSLRKLFKANGIAGYIIPSIDEFQSEYTAEYLNRLNWLTGFSGSNGMAIILEAQCAFFTDARYILQAKAQLGKEFSVHNMSDKSPSDWVAENLKGGSLGFCRYIHSAKNISKYKVPTKACDDLIDLLWKRDKSNPDSEIVVHELKYSGQSHRQKIESIAKGMNGDALIITTPASICWLLNIRGNDVPTTPLLNAYAIIYNDESVQLFADTVTDTSVDKHFGEQIKLYPFAQFKKKLELITDKNIELDLSRCPFFITVALKNIIAVNDPCELPKARKNKAEIDGARRAHIIDGVALTKFLYWIEQEIDKEEISEISASDKLLKFRMEAEEFVYPSFDTISAFGSNGAIVHYKASAATNKIIKDDNLYLLDSGGQYKFGTTDVTRTIHLGKPTAEHKKYYTRVLKGHIALASVIFPEGTSGGDLDTLARQYLWQIGADYKHGTGHGVGSYLGVHEGPQRIGKAASNAKLEPGMIISIEPGYYKEGDFGIRIENLAIVVKAESDGFLKFKTLTLAPLEEKLIDNSLLTDSERGWLRAYHQKINKNLAPHLDEKVKRWLCKFAYP